MLQNTHFIMDYKHVDIEECNLGAMIGCYAMHLYVNNAWTTLESIYDIYMPKLTIVNGK